MERLSFYPLPSINRYVLYVLFILLLELLFFDVCFCLHFITASFCFLLSRSIRFVSLWIICILCILQLLTFSILKSACLMTVLFSNTHSLTQGTQNTFHLHSISSHSRITHTSLIATKPKLFLNAFREKSNCNGCESL